ncbi:MAG TPA: hypothetical protein VK465_12615 [Fibrobacteria bacterium]|nr:hypothetical protein [Fibrobacteria bacterium]
MTRIIPSTTSNRGMRPNEKPLAAYLMARAAMNRAIDGRELQNLRVGHETVQETRNLLPYGRSNVREDIQKSNRNIDVRAMTANDFRDALAHDFGYTRDNMDVSSYYHIIAAASQFIKTGNCEAHASNSAALHAAKLADMNDERAVVAKAVRKDVNHIWTEMLSKGWRKDGTLKIHKHDVIMDGWCKEDIAILREDSRFGRADTKKQAQELTHYDLMNHITGSLHKDVVETYKTYIDISPHLQDPYNWNLSAYVEVGLKSRESDLFDATSVFHSRFQEQAGSVLHKDPSKPSFVKDLPTQGLDPAARQAKHASLAEIQAVGVARSLGETVPRKAVKQAPGIIASSQEMFP